MIYIDNETNEVYVFLFESGNLVFLSDKSGEIFTFDKDFFEAYFKKTTITKYQKEKKENGNNTE